jgi:hypothetical protein
MVDDEVVAPVVVVASGPVVVVVGGGLVVVVAGRLVVVAGRLAVVAGGSRDLRGGTLVEAPSVRRCGPRVVVGAAAAGGARTGAGSPWLAGAVSTPSTVPPTAPSATATTIVAHRRSTLNRTIAPARASPAR